MLEVIHILKDRIEINSPYRYLYGLKLISTIEKFSPLPQSVANMLYQRGLSSQDIREQILIFAFYRKKLSNVDGYLNEAYIFTYSYNFFKFLIMNLPNYKPLYGFGLANTLFRLHTLDEQIKVIDKKIVRSQIFKSKHIGTTPVNEFYRELVKNSLSKPQKIRAYLGVNLQDLANMGSMKIMLL
jgi:hypothetical protein